VVANSVNTAKKHTAASRFNIRHNGVSVIYDPNRSPLLLSLIFASADEIRKCFVCLFVYAFVCRKKTLRIYKQIDEVREVKRTID